MDDVPAPVAALAVAWDSWQDEATFPFSPDHCINGTRCAIEVLRTYEVRARPVSVQFALFNRFAWDLFIGGVPMTDWPQHAWSMGVGPDQPVSDREAWSGHLMVEGEGWVLDLSARQFDRPGRIISPGPLAMAMEIPAVGTWARITDEHRQTLLLARWPENNGWRTASGWRNPPSPALMTELHRRITAAQQRGTT